MTVTLVTGESLFLLRDIALPQILNRLSGKLHKYIPSAGVPRMVSEIECEGDRWIFVSWEQGVDKLYGIIFDRIITLGEMPEDFGLEAMTRLHNNCVEKITVLKRLLTNRRI